MRNRQLIQCDLRALMTGRIHLSKRTGLTPLRAQKIRHYLKYLACSLAHHAYQADMLMAADLNLRQYQRRQFSSAMIQNLRRMLHSVDNGIQHTTPQRRRNAVSPRAHQFASQRKYGTPIRKAA